ncbi:MAG: hypothetical protein IKY66_03790 [Bacteroidales bacterium]|nr:hypothetical protein [Bacteroidales bacterium]
MFTLLEINMYAIQKMVTTIGIWVVLPVLVVWLVNRKRTNDTNRKAEILLKAIESGVAIDPSILKENKRVRSIKEILLNRLTAAWVTTLVGIPFIVFGITTYILLERPQESVLMISGFGGVMLAVGIALFFVYSSGKKLFEAEIEAETKALKNKE